MPVLLPRHFSQLLAGPKTIGVEFQRFGKGLAGFGVLVFLAEAQAQPQIGFGVLGIELDGLAEIVGGQFGAAAHGRCLVDAGPSRWGLGWLSTPSAPWTIYPPSRQRRHSRSQGVPALSGRIPSERQALGRDPLQHLSGLPAAARRLPCLMQRRSPARHATELCRRQPHLAEA